MDRIILKEYDKQATKDLPFKIIDTGTEK